MTLPTASFSSSPQPLAAGFALQDGSAIDAATAQSLASVASGQVVSGTTQLTAFPIRARLTQFRSVEAGGTASLPPAAPGLIIDVYHDGANNLTLYPLEPGTSIDSAAAGASVTLSAGARCRYSCLAPGFWESALLGATSA